MNPILPTVRWLLVHELHDSTASWLAQQWRQRLGPRADELLVLSAPELARSAHWQMRREGPQLHYRLSVHTASGPAHVDSEQLRGVLHRPLGAWAAEHGSPESIDTERQALLLAWLHVLEARCINAPSTESPAGPMWPGAQWRWLAHRLGLPVRPWPVEPLQACLPMQRLLVAGDRCFSVNGAPLPAAWAAGARRLAAAAKCRLLGLYFVDDGELGWRFVQACTVPDLRCAGPGAAQALGAAMRMPDGAEMRLCA